MKKTFFFATALACLLSACESKLVEQVQLIPQAENVEILNGAYALKNLQSIQAPEAWKATAENFIEAVQLFRQLSGEGDVDFVFVIDNRTAEIIIDSREEDWG